MLGGGRSLFWKLKSLNLNTKEEAKPIARSLPHELYLEIFIRLPVKSTFTCKCVSKTWFSIISNPDFVKLHFSHALKINNVRFMLSGYDRMFEVTHIYTVTEHSLFSTTDKLVETEHCPLNLSSFISVLGSSGGLVCLRHHYHHEKEFYCLWNPATKEYKIIPDSPYHSVNWPASFCYDYKNDDYKLVSAEICLGTTRSFLVYVYTLRTNSWKILRTTFYSVENLNGVLVNGVLHWITKTPEVIVSFNISDENFKEIQIPGDITEKTLYTRLVLKVLEGCLCVILLRFNKAWVMREYGVWESWTKHQNKTGSDYRDLMWSSENGECLIYSNWTDLVLYSPKHSGARRLKLCFLKIGVVDHYVESLVSLNTGTYLGRTRRRGIWRK